MDINHKQIIDGVFLVGIVLAVIYAAAMVNWIGYISIPFNLVGLVIFGNALGVWRDEEIKKCSK